MEETTRLDGKGRDVALVLSSGGARGYAHIGAIEELEARGYRIRSVTGCSMGALVGGLYASGHLAELKEWVLSINRRKILSLTDVSMSVSHLVKGERIIQELNKIVPDCRIEDMSMPFRAVATDLRRQREVVFDRGSLYAAIRASISIPTYYDPLRTRKMLLVDGGITNPLPLNRAPRTEGDLLVAVNVSAPFSEEEEEKRRRARRLSERGGIFARVFRGSDEEAVNYYSLLNATIHTQIQQLARMQLRLTPPDVVVNVPMNRFWGLGYDRAARIIGEGRELMRRALEGTASDK
ncbi:MAG: patatin-like phospholipase family protein [Alloprevotella sp.]|nr:patatin-like phospholipase family protein [Alloprevotella sp.]